MIPAHHIHLPISAPSLRIIFSIQSPLPLGFAPLLHQQFQFQAFYVGQEAQQASTSAVVIFFLDRSMPGMQARWAVAGLQDGSDS